MPRAGLSHERVIAEATALADAEGLDALTLAAVAERVGVRVPSLYKHVSGLPEVRRRLAVDGLRDLGALLRQATGSAAGAREQLAAVAHAYRDFARRNPGRYAAAQRAPGEDDDEWQTAAWSATTALFAFVDAYGVPGGRRVHAARSVRAALHGFIDLERAGGFGMPVAVEASYEGLIAMLDAGLREAAAPGVPRQP